MAKQVGVAARTLVCLAFQPLRNSTIFRFAKNWDSDSARGKP